MLQISCAALFKYGFTFFFSQFLIQVKKEKIVTKKQKKIVLQYTKKTY